MNIQTLILCLYGFKESECIKEIEMGDNANSTEFLKQILAARKAWNESIKNILPNDMVKAGFCGHWSLKDVIAHITWYEREMINLLETKDFTTSSDLWELPTKERNAIIHESVKNLSLDQVVKDSVIIFDRFIELAAELSSDELNNPNHFPGMPKEWKPLDVIASNTYEHYIKHMPKTEDVQSNNL